MATDAEGRCRICVEVRTVPKHASWIHQPAGYLNQVSSPWPFTQWGLDILSPFPRVTSNRTFFLVAVDYFTKWTKAEALANIIVTRFGVPDSLVSDNGLQFDSKAFHEFCSNLGIKNKYSTPAYPQSNGQAEVVNKTIMNGLKKRLEGTKGKWAKELPNVLWTY